MPTVGSEIKQRKPFASPEQEAVVTVLRTAAVLQRHLDAVIGRHGITGQQYNVLRILRGAGERGLPTLEIASRMIEAAPGITRLLDRLQTKKLVTRERKRADLRCVECRITPAGRELLARLDAPVLDAAHDAFRSVSKQELAALVGTLDEVRDALRKKEKE